MSEHITLEHGSGGGITHRFITDEILRRFDNPALRPLEDGSHVMAGSQQLVVTMDTHAVDPPRFPGGDLGTLTISGTINDLVASGARPLFLTIGLTMSEGLSLDLIRTILDSVAKTAREAGVSVVAGDTKVIERDARGLYLHATGIGIPVVEGTGFALSSAQPGDLLLLTGSLGDHELAVLSQREGLGFEQRVSSDCASLHDLILPLLPKFESIRALRDPTRGGLTGALCDLAEAANVDVVVDHSALPVQHEVRAACEMLGLDFMEMVNEGKMLMVVGPDEASQVLAELHSHPLGHEATIIGEIDTLPGRGRLRLLQDGTERVVLRPEGTAIPRLC